MPSELKISVGQHSDKGRKETNQDFHGVLIPKEPLLTTKGIAIALADGISSSNVSQIASELAVKSFLTDYYCTSESWSVKTSAHRVLAATNSWLNAQTRRSPYLYDKDKGYVCTLSAMVIKSTTAHIFHVGDSRIYRLVGHALEQLTDDHRVIVSSEQSYLGRALGINHSNRNRLPNASSSKKATSLSWRPTGFTSMSGRALLPMRSATARTIWITRPQSHCRGVVPARQPRQPHRSNRPHR